MGSDCTLVGPILSDSILSCLEVIRPHCPPLTPTTLCVPPPLTPTTLCVPSAPPNPYYPMCAGLLGSLYSFLQFLTSPLLGASSDVYGRKPLLLLTMVQLCVPCQLLILHPVCRWECCCLTLSGLSPTTLDCLWWPVSWLVYPRAMLV